MVSRGTDVSGGNELERSSGRVRTLQNWVGRQLSLEKRRANAFKRCVRGSDAVSVIQDRNTERGVEVLLEVHTTPIRDDEFVRMAQEPYVHLGDISPGGGATCLRVRIE